MYDAEAEILVQQSATNPSEQGLGRELLAISILPPYSQVQPDTERCCALHFQSRADQVAQSLFVQYKIRPNPEILTVVSRFACEWGIFTIRIARHIAPVCSSC